MDKFPVDFTRANIKWKASYTDPQAVAELRQEIYNGVNSAADYHRNSYPHSYSPHVSDSVCEQLNKELHAIFGDAFNYYPYQGAFVIRLY